MTAQVATIPQSLSLTGLFPIGEELEKTKDTSKPKLNIIERFRLRKIRKTIIENTLKTTENEILEWKNDNISSTEFPNEADRIRALYRNAKGAARAIKANIKSSIFAVLSFALGISSGIISALSPEPVSKIACAAISKASMAFSFFTLVSTLKGAVKTHKSNKSDNVLKSADFAEGLEPFIEKYDAVITRLNGDQQMLLEKRASCSKKEFAEFMKGYEAEITEMLDQMSTPKAVEKPAEQKPEPQEQKPEKTNTKPEAKPADDDIHERVR